MNDQSHLRHCDFCGSYVPRDEPLGEAECYICFEDDRENGVKTTRICLDCATSKVENPDEIMVSTCDICGHQGYTSASRLDDGKGEEAVYRDATVQSWSVRICRLEGHVDSCVDCTPIKKADLLIERPDRRTVAYADQ